jgi:RNA polymerase sigma-70 factor (ECF subfamily)
METGDEILAEFVRGRGADAFGRLMQREMGFVYAAALRQCGNRELADDAAQAVFVLLWQKRETVKIGVPIKAWLFRATRYVVANARRAEARRAYREREAAAMRSEIAAAEGSGADAEMLGMLDDAMASLSEKDRQAVLCGSA